MVIIDVIEFEVLDGVELDGEDMVGEIAVIGVVKEAEVLAGEGTVEVGGGGDNKSHAVAAELSELGDGADGEGGREGDDGGGGGGGGGGGFEFDRRGVEGVANDAGSGVGELDDLVVVDQLC